MDAVEAEALEGVVEPVREIARVADRGALHAAARLADRVDGVQRTPGQALDERVPEDRGGTGAVQQHHRRPVAGPVEHM